MDLFSDWQRGLSYNIGMNIKMHADHIKPFAIYPDLRFEVSNGRTLCSACHRKTESFGRGTMYRKIMATGSEA